MTRFDVFNGDADGLCAVQQWRLVHPADDAVVVTGAKREVVLLPHVDAAAGDEVAVFDLSMHANRDALPRVLAAGARVRWFDHHHAGDVPVHPALEVHVDTGPATCTSLIVDRVLGHAHARWAAVGAFGDNLHAPARALCASLGLDEATVARLRALGEALNHNAYADDPRDLVVHPRELRDAMRGQVDPLAFADRTPACAAMLAAHRDDLAAVLALRPRDARPGAAVWVLPDTAWARRVRGTLGNRLAEREPGRAVAIVAPRADGAYTVSVRVPPTADTRADTFCLRWPGGGGRAIAAGVDRLDAGALDAFARAFVDAYGTPASPAASGRATS